MLREHKKIVSDFEARARPVDMVNFIQQKEIILLLKEIRKELKDRD